MLHEYCQSSHCCTGRPAVLPSAGGGRGDSELCSLTPASQPRQQRLFISSSFSFTAARDREREVLLLVMNFVLGGHHYKHCFIWRQQVLSIELNCHSMTISRLLLLLNTTNWWRRRLGRLTAGRPANLCIWSHIWPLHCLNMTRLQDLVHAQVYSLDDVPAIVEHPPDVLRVHGAGEVRVAVVRTVLLGVATARLLRYLNTSTLTSMDFSQLLAQIVFTSTHWKLNYYTVCRLREKNDEKGLKLTPIHWCYWPSPVGSCREWSILPGWTPCRRPGQFRAAPRGEACSGQIRGNNLLVSTCRT